MNTDMVKISEVLEKINGFIEGKVSQQDLDDWCSCIKFKTTIPLRNKCVAINKIIHEMSYDGTEVDLFVQMEMNKFWYGLLELYTNIDISEVELLTEQNYDTLNIFVYDWMLGYVEKDYTRFLKIFNQFFVYSLNFEMTNEFANSLQSFGDIITKDNEDLLSIVKNDKGLIHDLSQIAMMGSQIKLPEEEN